MSDYTPPPPGTKPNCYQCQHRRALIRDQHSACRHPAFDAIHNRFAYIAGRKAAALEIPRELLIAEGCRVVGQAHGVRKGWFAHPLNFDPVWLISCEGFEARVPSTAEQVRAIAQDCLIRDDTPTETDVKVEAIGHNFAFRPQRLAAHRAEIIALCNRLPDGFQKSGGGGWSFLNVAFTKDGKQWGTHRDSEMLLALAIASGLAGIIDPPDKWEARPGCVPYVYFDTAGFCDVPPAPPG